MEMKIKTSMRYHYVPIKMAKIEIENISVITQLFLRRKDCESQKAGVEA